MGYAVFAYTNSLNAYLKHSGCLKKFYLLNTSFKAFAGKNLTFCDAAI